MVLIQTQHNCPQKTPELAAQIICKASFGGVLEKLVVQCPRQILLVPKHLEDSLYTWTATGGTLRVEFSSQMKTPVLSASFQFLTPWCLVKFEMLFLASSCSSRKVKASHKACVLLTLCRHLRILPKGPVHGSLTGALGSTCGGLSSQHSWWRAGQHSQQSLEGSSPRTCIWLPLVCILLWHCSLAALWVECRVVLSLIAYEKENNQKRGSLYFLFSLNSYFIEEILQTISPDFPQKLGHLCWPWSTVEDPGKLQTLTHCPLHVHSDTVGKPLTPVPLPGKNL